MHGVIYNVAEKDGQLSIYASFGGLLMRLQGARASLQKPGLELDQNIYLLIRK